MSAITDRPGPHCSYRLFEWTMALAMAAFGAHVTMAPYTLSNSRYAAVLAIFSSFQFGLLCFLVGLSRMIALSKNGNWPRYGSRIRAVLAFVAALIWAQLAAALAQSPTLAAPSPGMWIYCALTLAELRSVWRARREANGSGNH